MLNQLPLARTIERQLQVVSERVQMRFLGGEVEIAALTGADIDLEARRVASGLLAAGLGGGKRALLVLESGPGFLQALMGCLYAGVVAVPAPEPRPGASLDRLESIADAGEVSAVVTSARIATDLIGRMREGSPLAAVPLLDIAALALESPGACPGFDVGPGTPVIIQYTSGSTGTPRGVILNSACILANVERQAIGMNVLQPDVPEVFVNWMPHFHDLGLVGKYLTPLVKGVEAVHMPPLAFVQRPARWLKAISRYGGTVSGAPAFAFDLCVSRISDEIIDDLDLSSWRVAFCGAEPVFRASMDAFRKRFARAGLRPESVFACYGLAEMTLFAGGSPAVVAGADRSAATDSIREPCYLETVSRSTIRIVDAGGGVVADGEEGEIWISDASVAGGYLNEPEASREMFAARLTPDDGRVYLRTGDLGRIVGEALTITGRIKDVLISGGANVAAADVERYATRDLPQLNPHGAAAFHGSDEEGAPVILLVERQRRADEALDDDELVRRIRRAVFDGLGLSLDEVGLLKPGVLPRTTSGKVRRSAAGALRAQRERVAS